MVAQKQNVCFDKIPSKLMKHACQITVSGPVKKSLTVTAMTIGITLVSSTAITEERSRDIDTDLLTIVCLVALTFIEI